MPSLEDLHADLVTGDLRVASKIVEAALPKMLRLITSLVPRLYDGHEDACLEALLDYLQAPTAYDPARAGLLTYLVTKAHSRARTAARGQRRRQFHEQSYVAERTITVADETAGENVALARIELRQLIDEHGSIICPDEDDGEIFLLMAAGERYFPAYLEVLNLDDTPDNRAAVERRRERIRGRVRRLQPQLNG
jgi:hypothetical protein